MKVTESKQWPFAVKAFQVDIETTMNTKANSDSHTMTYTDIHIHTYTDIIYKYIKEHQNNESQTTHTTANIHKKQMNSHTTTHTMNPKIIIHTTTYSMTQTRKNPLSYKIAYTMTQNKVFEIRLNRQIIQTKKINITIYSALIYTNTHWHSLTYTDTHWHILTRTDLFSVF